MRTDLFDYDLPRELIAQEPIDQRDHARLMVIERSNANIAHHRFYELPSLLSPGDVIVLNDTKVIRARLIGRREPTGGRVELLLLRECEDGVWEVLVRPGRRAKVGTRITFAHDFYGDIIKVTHTGTRIVQFNACQQGFWEALERYGKVPLPPYIKREFDDDTPYQTVYATKPGAVAAPTAGLHFTPKLLSALANVGIRIATITLHVGWATFKPINTECIEKHNMSEEYCEVPQESAELINDAIAHGKRVVAVGTTVVRTLESVADANGYVRAWAGWTRLYITPGYDFRIIRALITNFHLPRSTNLVLVAAFAGIELTRHAYEIAIKERYRFYSFGDAMLIL